MVHPRAGHLSAPGWETEAGAWQTHKAGEARSSLRTYFFCGRNWAEGASQGSYLGRGRLSAVNQVSYLQCT